MHCQPPADCRAAAPAAASRGLLPAVLAAALLSAACQPATPPDGAAAGGASRPVRHGRGPAAPVVPGTRPVLDDDGPRGSPDLGPHSRRLLDDFLLNALLVPLLDPEPVRPVRWADPTLNPDCGEPSLGRVDGRPVPVGEPLTGRAFTVRWDFVGCRPFSADGPALDGVVELFVLPENEGLSAIVTPHSLTVTDRAGERVLAARRFVVRARWTL